MNAHTNTIIMKPEQGEAHCAEAMQFVFLFMLIHSIYEGNRTLSRYTSSRDGGGAIQQAVTLLEH